MPQGDLKEALRNGRRAAPGPGSLTWRLMGDARGLLLAPMALVLQVAHPVVGAGVAEHSNFLSDPWGRLMRTINSTVRFTYGDDHTARTEAARLRLLHRSIRGTDPQGRRYSALDPSAYAWVHLTLAYFAVEVRRVFSRPLTEEEAELFYQEWRQVGLRLGVRNDRMPPDWEAFGVYFEEMVDHVLEVNEAVHQVLGATRHPPAPGRWVPRPLWYPMAQLAGGVESLFTAGTLPPAFREAIGLRWTPLEEAEMLAAALMVRVAMDVTPPPFRYFPQLAPHVMRAWRVTPR